MADVQLEHGFFRFANRLAEAVAYGNFSISQAKIVLCLIRMTYGWQRLTVRISHPDLARRCGLQLSGSFRRAFTELVEEGVVREIMKSSGKIAGAYSVQKDFENWGKFSIAEATLRSLHGQRPGNVDRMPVPLADASGYVYYAKDDDEVKIGFSVDPWSRVIDMRTVRPTVDLIAIEPGTRQTESQRHAQFGSARIHDRREWFRWTGEIELHISMISGATLNSPKYDPVELRALTETVDPYGTDDDEMTTSQGRGQSPVGVMKTPYNSSNGNGLRDRKDIERQRDEIKTATAGDVDQSKFSIRLVSGMNAAISGRWGEQINPLSFGQCSQLAADLIQEGFTDLDISRAAIETACTASRQPSPPAHPNYFRNVIREAHQRAQQIAFDDKQPQKRNGNHGTSPIAHLVDPAAHAREMELEREWNRERRLAAIEWGKDPINAQRYSDIVVSAGLKMQVDVRLPWTLTARDEEVVQQCINAIDFPSFNVWRTERDRTPGDVADVPRGTVETRG